MGNLLSIDRPGVKNHLQEVFKATNEKALQQKVKPRSSSTCLGKSRPTVLSCHHLRSISCFSGAMGERKAPVIHEFLWGLEANSFFPIIKEGFKCWCSKKRRWAERCSPKEKTTGPLVFIHLGKRKHGQAKPRKVVCANKMEMQKRSRSKGGFIWRSKVGRQSETGRGFVYVHTSRRFIAGIVVYWIWGVSCGFFMARQPRRDVYSSSKADQRSCLLPAKQKRTKTSDTLISSEVAPYLKRQSSLHGEEVVAQKATEFWISQGPGRCPGEGFEPAANSPRRRRMQWPTSTQ